MEAKDDATRTGRLKAHARHLRDHIDGLGAKAYWEQFQPTPEFVVMFVPAEVFLSAALEEDPTLFEHAFARDVVIATPQTLIALLRTIAYTWRQEALAANAQQVYLLGRELHGRLATMGGHLAKLGAGIEGAVKAYNNTVTSLESRVLVTARRLGDLKVTDDELLTRPRSRSRPGRSRPPSWWRRPPRRWSCSTRRGATTHGRRDRVVAEIEADPRYGVETEAPPGLFSLPRSGRPSRQRGVALATVTTPTRPARPAASPGLTAPGVVVIVFAASVFALLIDVFTGNGIGWIFGAVFIAASGYAALQVRRADVAAAMIAPPLVFAVLVVGDKIISSPGELLTKVVAGMNGLLDDGPMLWIGSGLTVVIVAYRLWQERHQRASWSPAPSRPAPYSPQTSPQTSSPMPSSPAPSGPAAAPEAARTADAPPPS